MKKRSSKRPKGRVAERSIASALKAEGAKASVGSNPTPSEYDFSNGVRGKYIRRGAELKMIWWGKHKPQTKVIELTGGSVKKSVSLEDAARDYLNCGKLHYPETVKKSIGNLFSVVDKSRPILTFTVKDAQDVFHKMLKAKNEAYAYHARGVLANIIRYAATGEVPAPINRVSQKQSDGNASADDVGKLKFSKASIASIQHLIPLYSTSGRFGWIKAEIQKLIHSLEAGEAGVIEAPKRSMTEKEAKAICTTVTGMFAKGNLPWAIKYNPNDSVFIVLRNTDFENLFPKKAKKEGKK